MVSIWAAPDRTWVLHVQGTFYNNAFFLRIIDINVELLFAVESLHFLVMRYAQIYEDELVYSTQASAEHEQ